VAPKRRAEKASAWEGGEAKPWEEGEAPFQMGERGRVAKTEAEGIPGGRLEIPRGNQLGCG
jgi:hypothetical protein